MHRPRGILPQTGRKPAISMKVFDRDQSTGHPYDSATTCRAAKRRMRRFATRLSAEAAAEFAI
jgi:hypothetical protein